jgi:hypothetical protein
MIYYTVFEIYSCVSRLTTGCFEKIKKYWVWNFESLCMWFLFQGEETPKHSSVTVTGSMKKSQIQKFIVKQIFYDLLCILHLPAISPTLTFELPGGKGRGRGLEVIISLMCYMDELHLASTVVTCTYHLL